MNKIVGMDKIVELEKADKAKAMGINLAEQQRAKEIDNIEKNAFVKPKKKKPRGSALWDEKRKKEHMDKMRVKATETKRRKKKERDERKKELEQMKLCKKLGISMETLLEYEDKRQQFKKQKEQNVVEEKPKQIKKEVPKQVPQQAPRQAPRQVQRQAPQEIDYDRLSTMIYTRIRQEDNARIMKRQEEKIAEQNRKYFQGLGRANMNKKKSDDAWLKMFKRK